MSQLSSIDKLNGDNYGTWCVQMKCLLITLDLWSTLETACPQEEPAKVLWKSKDAKALATILLAVKTSELVHIKSCLSASGAWSKLSNLYKTTNPGKKVNLFKKLVTYKFNSGERYADQIKSFCAIVDDLKDIGISLNDDLVSIMLLSSLPEDMENFVVAVECRDDLPKVDVLISKILEEEMRQGSKASADEGVFAANGRRGNWKNTGKPVKQNVEKNVKSNSRECKLVCFKCKKVGHVRANCKEVERQDRANAASDGSQHSCGSDWILDSGATSHMCRNKGMFSSFKMKKQEIVLASGDIIYAEGFGDVVLLTKQNVKYTLLNVWYVPKLHSNFISITKIVESGKQVIFKNNSALIKAENELIASAKLENKVFILKAKLHNEAINAVAGSKQLDLAIKWHRRYGHLNMKDLNKLSNKNMVNGLDGGLPAEISCETCALCKITAKPFHTYSGVQSHEVLELVHTDLCGPMNVKTLAGSRYFITFVDDYSRYVCIYFLKDKSDVFEAFSKYVTMAERQTGKKLKILRSDNGTEYVNKKFKDYCSRNGVIHQTTMVYTPQQNGIAERLNRTLCEMSRCMLKQSELQQYMWGEAVGTSVFLRNRAPTSILKDATPFERWYKRKPSVGYFKTFGCDVVSLQKGRKVKSAKFLPKGNKLKFIGYDETRKGYKLYNPDTKIISYSRDVIFFEESFEKKSSTNDAEYFYFDIFKSCNDVSCADDAHEVGEDSGNSGDDDLMSGEIAIPVNDGASNDEMMEIDDEESDEEPLEISTEREESIVDDGKRKRGRPTINRTGSRGRPRKIYCTETLNAVIENPKSVKEALKSDDANEWKSAMEKEYNSLMKNKTWILVDKPKGKNVIGSKWVFALKRKPDGSIEKYKARLVAHGCSQMYNVDYTETFAPVVRHTTIRTILALAAKMKLKMNHVDIVAAYLNGKLEEDVYMAQPKMFEDTKNPHKVCKLKKSLYGLKQAGREWNKVVNDILINMKFKRCQSDGCVYYRKRGNVICIIALYVDDMLIAYSHIDEMKNVFDNISKSVEAVDRGPISFYLGMEIDHDSSGDITIHQRKYTQELKRLSKLGQN